MEFLFDSWLVARRLSDSQIEKTIKVYEVKNDNDILP